MRSFPRILLFCFYCLLLVRCSDDSSVSPSEAYLPEPDMITRTLNGDKTIGFGETILVSDENLYITFSKVSEGRCPTGALCFWEGEAVASFMVSVPARKPVRVTVAIRPSSDPMRGPETIAEALGYRFILVGLDPYPVLDHETPDDDYIAVLRVFDVNLQPSVHPISPPDPVIISNQLPIAFQRDAVSVLEGSIEDDVLMLRASHGGGCGKHAYRLFWRPGSMESYPVQTNLFLQHIDLGDPCDAIVAPVLYFDIEVIAAEYRCWYGGSDDIILNIYGYFEDEPGDRIQVTYSPD